MLNARIPGDEFADIEKTAEREQVDRTMAVRLMLAYAARYMPRGWRPDTEQED